MKGRVKAGQGTLVGNAGEHYVMAELLRRGVIAALAPRNAPGFDILAAKAEKTIRIRVKTKSEESGGWQWVAKRDGTLFRFLGPKDDFTVLVDLANITRDLAFYVLPTFVLNEWLVAEFEAWKATPGKRGQPHNPNNTLRHFGAAAHAPQLQQYRDAWDLLWA